MINAIAKYIKREDGATAVEFALIAFGFLTLVFGIFESGRMFMTWNAFQYSIEDTARRALVTEDVTEAEVEATIRENLPDLMLDSDRATINVAFTDYSDVNILEITGTYAFNPIVLAFLPDSWATIDLYAQSRLPMSWE